MEVNTTLSLQLHKLPATISEETLEQVLETLWKTRKTGLRDGEKSSISAILNLPSVEELDPVLVCLRSLIRKCVHESLTGDNLLKLFPPDLSLNLQTILVLLLQKHQNQWKEDASREQSQSQRTTIQYPGTVNMRQPPFTQFSASETSLPMWPGQDDARVCFNRNDVGDCTLLTSDINASHVAPFSPQHDDSLPDHMVILPRLKSMTWTMQNRSSTSANRVAVISLKLQDYSKSASGETEVKFQLTKDTLEAMLRSMTYISDQLANILRTTPTYQSSVTFGIFFGWTILRATGKEAETIGAVIQFVLLIINRDVCGLSHTTVAAAEGHIGGVCTSNRLQQVTGSEKHLQDGENQYST